MTTGEPTRSAETAAPKVAGTNRTLGLAFEYDLAEEAAHRAALRTAIQQASNRERNFDQPWWAVNMKAALDYIEALEWSLNGYRRVVPS